MRRTLLLASFACSLFGFCTPKDNKTSNTSKTDSLINTGGHNGDKYEEGKSLLAKNDCLTCHAVDKDMFGPSFLTIAIKYHNNEKYAEYLSNSVLKGSKGIYGEKQMTPHPTIPVNDLQKMMEYILSVRKQ